MMVSQATFQDVLSIVLHKRFSEVEKLSEAQEQTLFGVVNRNDAFAILPTGHGKSIIFQLIPDLCEELHRRKFNYPKKAIVLVICPLNSLVESHIRELHDRGLRATNLTGDVDEKGIQAGLYSFIFASPESFLNTGKWREMLKSQVYQKNVFSIVTDEAHVVPKWGYKKSSNGMSKKEFVAAFRESFSRLGEMRSLVSQDVPMLALNATANLETRNLIRKSLCLRKDCVEIFLSPDRQNIYLDRRRITSNLERTFAWLIDKLSTEMEAMQKTIVYCKSIKDCGQLYRLFQEKVGDVTQSKLFGMYHHSTPQRIKDCIIESLFDDGPYRRVFATNALGMGVNLKDVTTIVHYGPPREIEELLQQIGRAGRDGKPATAIVLFKGVHLRNCQDSIRDFCLEEGCLRKVLLKDFGVNETSVKTKHECCIQCHKECSCTFEKCNADLPDYGLEQNDNSNIRKSRTICKQDKALLTEILEDYQFHLTSCCLAFLGQDCAKQYAKSLVASVIKHSKFIFDTNYILDNLPIFRKQHAIEVLLMFQDVFGDIEEEKLACELPEEEEEPLESYDLSVLYDELESECFYGDNTSSSDEFSDLD